MTDPIARRRIDLGTDDLLFETGPVAWLTFNRPQARNAMTWAMYDGLYAACEHVDADEAVRAFVLRGAGDRAFVAGTDISQFQAFKTAEDALHYERSVNRYVSRLEAVQKPTIAMIRGYCVGGGAAIAIACDLRIAGSRREVRRADRPHAGEHAVGTEPRAAGRADRAGPHQGAPLHGALRRRRGGEGDRPVQRGGRGGSAASPARKRSLDSSPATPRSRCAPSRRACGACWCMGASTSRPTCT